MIQTIEVHGDDPHDIDIVLTSTNEIEKALLVALAESQNRIDITADIPVTSGPAKLYIEFRPQE
jgi:hypothetical protein